MKRNNAANEPRTVRSEFCPGRNYCGHTRWELTTKDGRRLVIEAHWLLSYDGKAPVVQTAPGVFLELKRVR